MLKSICKLLGVLLLLTGGVLCALTLRDLYKSRIQRCYYAAN